jgi:hypothetical protein
VVQDAKIEALDLLVADLIAKTGRDSQNSSKPPSSDGPGMRADRRRAERERRKSEPPRWSTACSAPRCRPGGSIRWITKIAARLAGNLHGFEGDVKTALLAEPVALADETPVTTIEDTPGADGQAGSGRAFRPHVFTLRSEHLVWLGDRDD